MPTPSNLSKSTALEPYTSPLPSTLQSYRTRNLLKHYPYRQTHRLRWSDNDPFAHVNNPIYGILCDTIVNTFLMEHCDYHPWSSIKPGVNETFPPPSFPSTSPASPSHKPTATSATSPAADSGTSPYAAIIAETYATYLGSLSYPGSVTIGMRIARLGKASVRYEVGFFEREGGDEKCRAVAGSTHVFVGFERGSGVLGGVLEGGMPEGVRAGFERLILEQDRWIGDGEHGGKRGEGGKSKL